MPELLTEPTLRRSICLNSHKGIRATIRSGAINVTDCKKLILILLVFPGAYFIPDDLRIGAAVVESLAMAREYAREHVLFCLVPAFFIAGAIGAFVSRL